MITGSTGIAGLLAQGMEPSLHWYPEDVPVSRLAATLVAMANGGGGTVLLGIAPRTPAIMGVRDVPRTVDCVFQAALLADPPLVLPLPEVISIASPSGPVHIVSATVPAGLPYVYNLDGRYLGREGFHNVPFPARRLRLLLMERGVVQFESRSPPDARLEDLDAQQIEAYRDVMRLPGERAEEMLVMRGCLQRVEGGLRPTYAALLLFGRYPQQWLPTATLLAARFTGLAYSDHFVKQEINGTLPEQIRQAEAFVRTNLRSTARLVGLTRQDLPEYPYEAVRELLVNAVAHRDYNLQGDCIHLNIFADRLEVHSPGGLPGPVTLDNLLEARFSRNAVITQVLADLGFVEKLGYGLDRVVAALQENGLRPAHFEEVAGTFRVTLYSAIASLEPGEAPAGLEEYLALDLNIRQQLALDYLIRRQRITSHVYQGLCPGVHPETLRRDLAELVERGILLKIGDKRATYYILKRIPKSSA